MRCARRNTGLVPKRTNLFQQVIAIVHGHLAGDVTVEESAMLVSRSTGKPREVDVVIRSRVAGYEAIVKIEARATGRRADRTWVDGQIGKHADLPPGQLVLVSERGFTPDARVHAEANGVICYAPADLAADDPALGIVKALPALWPKQLSLTYESGTALVDTPSGNRLRVRPVPPDAVLFDQEGAPIATFLDAFQLLLNEKFQELSHMIGLPDMEEDRDEPFTMGMGDGENPLVLVTNAEPRMIHLRYEDANPPELHGVLNLEMTGRAAIHVGKIPLAHKRLRKDVAYSYGEGTVGGNNALLVISETRDGTETASLRLRTPDGGVADVPLKLAAGADPDARAHA